MRFCITILVLLISGMATAQQYKVVEWPGKSSVEILDELRIWTASTFNSAKDVIQLDKEGRFIVKGVDNYSVAGSGLYTLSYTVDFQIKDEKFRYIIKDEFVSSLAGALPLDKLKSTVAENRTAAETMPGAAKKGLLQGTEVMNGAAKRFDATLEAIRMSIEALPKLENDNW